MRLTRERRELLVGWLLVAAFVVVACLQGGCSTITPHIDPPLHFAATDLEAYVDASDESIVTGGDVYRVRPTGSMEPLLTGADYIVTQPVPFASLRVGNVITYQADWAPPPDDYVTHRIVAIDRDGLVMSGDANPTSEAAWRVNDGEDKGLVVSIWRVAK